MQKAKLNETYTDDTGKSHDIAWIDLDIEFPGSIQWLSNDSKINDNLINLLIARNNLNRHCQYKHATIINLSYAKQTLSSDTVNINCLVEDNRVITVHWGEMEILEKFHNTLKNSREPTTSWGFIATVVSILSDEMAVHIGELGLLIDKIEDQTLESGNALPLNQLACFRRRLMRMKRYKKSIADLIKNISNDPTLSILKKVRDQMAETSEVIKEHANNFELYLERAMLIQDQIQNQLYDKMNKATYRLGVVATVFLPLSFITGLLGINVAGIPGDHNHYAFWLVCFFLIIVAIVSTVLVNRKKDF